MISHLAATRLSISSRVRAMGRLRQRFTSRFARSHGPALPHKNFLAAFPSNAAKDMFDKL
jgi:hypothetical protein